jgi:hypothetical protein
MNIYQFEAVAQALVARGNGALEWIVIPFHSIQT